MQRQSTPTIEQTQFLRAGTIVNGRYRIEEVLGCGGFGITYKAWDPILKSRVAIKEYFPAQIAARSKESDEISVVLPQNRGEYEAGKIRMLEEAQSIAKFQEVESIVSIFDFIEANETAYIVMEYLEGCTLKEYVKRQGPFGEAMLIHVALSVLGALERLHEKNIMHRDISPDNVFICEDMTVKLIDFGAAKQALADDEQTLSILIKPGYAPPEQYAAKSKQGPWTDIYSLGATLYYCLTGNKPEDGMARSIEDALTPLKKLRPEMNERTLLVIEKAMAVKREDRYEDAHAMQSEFLLSFEKPKKKTGKLRLAICAGCLLLVGVIVWFVAHWAPTMERSSDSGGMDTELLTEAASATDENLTEEPEKQTDTLTQTASPNDAEEDKTAEREDEKTEDTQQEVSDEPISVYDITSYGLKNVTVEYIESSDIPILYYKDEADWNSMYGASGKYYGPRIKIAGDYYSQNTVDYLEADSYGYLNTGYTLKRYDEGAGIYLPIYPIMGDFDGSYVTYENIYSIIYSLGKTQMSAEFALKEELPDGKYALVYEVGDKDNNELMEVSFTIELHHGVPEDAPYRWE